MKKIIIPLLLAVFFLMTSYRTFSQQTTSPKASLNHVALYVTNLKISSSFYQTIISLDTIPEPFHDGKHAWFRIGTGITLHIIQGAEAKKEYYKNQHTCFSVASVGDFIKILQKNNIA